MKRNLYLLAILALVQSFSSIGNAGNVTSLRGGGGMNVQSNTTSTCPYWSNGVWIPCDHAAVVANAAGQFHPTGPVEGGGD